MFFKKKKEPDPSEKIVREAAVKLVADLTDLQKEIENYQKLLKEVIKQTETR